MQKNSGRLSENSIPLLRLLRRLLRAVAVATLPVDNLAYGIGRRLTVDQSRHPGATPERFPRSEYHPI